METALLAVLVIWVWIMAARVLGRFQTEIDGGDGGSGGCCDGGGDGVGGD